MHGLAHDVAFAVRVWRKRPALALATVLALAFGIAATSLAFSILNAFFLRPLPVSEPDRLVRIYSSYTQGLQHFTLSYPDFSDIRDLTTVFAGAIAEEPVPFSLSASGAAERIYGEQVAGGYFSVLGVRPLVGRFFTPAEEAALGPSPVVVLSEDLWRRRFGADRAIAGRSVSLNAQPCEIVGVAPDGFRGVTAGVRPEIWRPAGRDRTANRGGRGFFVAARLQPGVTIDRARAAVDVLARQLQQEHPETNSGIRFPVLSEFESRMHPLVRGSVLGLSGTFLAVGATLLLLACANAAGILLVAALARRREIGVRLALGASRRRVARQFLTEASLLAIVAGVIGVALASWIAGLLGSITLPTRLPLFFDFGLDRGVLAFSVAAVVATTILCGLAPALQGSRLDLISMLREARPGRLQPARLRAGLVALQVGLAVVLLMAGAVFVRSLANAQHVSLGFDPRGVVTASVDPGLQGYSSEAVASFWSRLTPAVASLPGVESVSLATTVPFELNITRMSLGPEGYQPTRESGWPSVDWAAVDPDYFRTLRIGFLEGRDFAQSDRAGSPAVAIVNEELARQFWPGSSAVGRRLVTPSGVCCQVVGVVRGSRWLTLGEEPKPQIYFSFTQSGARAGTVVARASGEGREGLEEVRTAIGVLDSTLPIYNAGTMEDHVRVARLPAVAAAVSAAIISLVGLLLTGLGLYGSIAHVVASREKEIGVRRALGAGPYRVLWLVLRQAAGFVMLGSLAGFVGGLAAARVLRAFVYDVGAADPLVVVVAPAILALVCGIAAGLPALAALRVDTARALRCE